MSLPAFPASKDRVPIPVLKVTGVSQNAAVTHSAATAALAVRVGDTEALQMVRLWSFGCASYYKLGASGVAAPTLADGCIPKDSYVETYLSGLETHVRAIGKPDEGGSTASGTFRVELLG